MSIQHEISMGYRVTSLPADMNTRAALQHMIHVVKGTEKLAPGLRVVWTVRGVVHDFEDAVRTANSGLLKLMERRLMRDLAAINSRLEKVPPVRDMEVPF